MRADSSAIRFSSSFRSSGWLHDCSVIENPDAGGVAWDGKVIVSNAMTHLTPGFRCPLPGPWTGRWPRFGLCGHNTRAGSGVRALRAKKELNRRTRGLRRIKCPRPCQPPTRKIANFDMVFSLETPQFFPTYRAQDLGSRSADSEWANPLHPSFAQRKKFSRGGGFRASATGAWHLVTYPC